MAAAYASLISINQLIEQIQLHHTRRRKPSYSAEQLKQIESLNETTSFLQEFLENYSNKNEVEILENEIRDVVDEAQDIIESHMVDYILSPSVEEHISSFEGLEKLIEGMNSVKEVVMKIKDCLQPRDLVHPGSLGPPTSTKDISTVEVGERLNQIMDKLTRGQYDLQIIPIIGMGGIGKTTLAKKLFDHPYRRHFDICAWVTISQVYNIGEVLSNLLQEITNESDPGSSDFQELGKELHQLLFGRRFLIVIDDMWDTDVWDKLKLFIPDQNKGSRMLVTTRLLKVANYVNSSGLYEMDFLDENESWSLLCRKAFGQEGCPNPEFEEIAKRIAKNCKGLPLSIVVIAGFIAKSKLTREFLESVVKDTNRTINSEDNDNSLRLLLLSYNHLPIHLKPCLLHMGAYPEDHKIRISKLIRLWVAEGFLKPNKPKILEEVAEEYLKDLIERNLIMVDGLGSTGTMKTCVMHDLVRDLCLRESDKSKFLCVTKMFCNYISFITNGARRIVSHYVDFEDVTHKGFVSDYLESIIHARSLTLHCPTREPVLSDNLKLLRVFSMFPLPIGSKVEHYYYMAKFFSPMELYNLRYIDAFLNPKITLLNKRRNLQTIIVKTGVGFNVEALDIWKMLELRHLKSKAIYLSDPPLSCGLEEEYVLENLQTLSRIENFKCTEKVLKRIPNVKKLGLRYDGETFEYSKDYALNILDRLHKLESLEIIFEGSVTSKFNISVFPTTLKSLHLEGCCEFDDAIINIGQLPNLEKLTLACIIGLKEWVSVEGHFSCLKFLDLATSQTMVGPTTRRIRKHMCPKMNMIWKADDSHFPVLECLVLRWMNVEIPFGFADSTTLRSIHLMDCNKSTIDSAKNILEEQKSLGVEESLRITVFDGMRGTSVYE